MPYLGVNQIVVQMIDDDPVMITKGGSMILRSQPRKFIIGMQMSLGEFYYTCEQYDEDQRRFVKVRLRRGGSGGELRQGDGGNQPICPGF